MNPKLEINDADFLKNSIKIMNELNNNNTFLFYFNHDIYSYFVILSIFSFMS